MSDNIAKFFLSFSHDIIIIPLIILGYIWLNQRVFFHAICLLLVSMLFNFALKATFQVPLSPALGKEGFAFPSGHMQSCVVLYGWLMTKMPKLLYKMGIVILLAGVGKSLVYFGYHNYFDILGAIFFGSLLIVAYRFLGDFQKQALLPIVLVSFSTICMIYIAAVHGVLYDLWMAYYALIGIIFSENLFIKRPIKANLPSKILSTIFCFAMIFTVKKLFSFIDLPAFLAQMQWLIIGFSIPCSRHVWGFFKNNFFLKQTT